jgi:hypothetical protein
MFVPYGRNRGDLDKARKGERDRSFSAGAGACVLTKALVLVPYILDGPRRRTQNVKPTFEWREPLSERDLLLFEAFITHVGKGASHEECARLAIKRFPKESTERVSLKSAVEEPSTFNLLGAMLLRTGWTDDPKVLLEPCLVVRHQGNSE